MKKIIIFFWTILFLKGILAQGLTGNGDGTGSILFRGSNLGLDLGKTELSFQLNNLPKVIGAPKGCFYGISLSGKNEEGIGNLFSAGDIVPEGKLGGLLGYTWSNGVVPQIEARRLELAKREIRILKNAEDQFYKEMPVFVKRYTNDSDLKELREGLLIALNDRVTMVKFDDLLVSKDSDNQLIKTAKKAILTEYDKMATRFDDLLVETNKLLNAVSKELAEKSYNQFFIFTKLGFNTLGFKRFTSLDTVNFSNSFTNENFQGGFVSLGINYQYNSWIFGINYSYDYGNSFSALDKKEYTLKSTNSNASQSLSSEKKIVGYSGDYQIVEMNNFKVDVVYNLLLDSVSRNHLLFNPYFRARTHSSNSKLMPYVMDLGLGLYFLNDQGKFMGGIYTEFGDLQNKYEKIKPEADQNLRNPLKRGTIGIITKFSINSLLNLF